VSHAGLHQLQRQFESAIAAPVDAPTRVEVPQAVEPGVFGLAAVGDAGRDLRRVEAAVDDIADVLDVAAAVAEDQIVRRRDLRVLSRIGGI